jgi:hypothetical protein
MMAPRSIASHDWYVRKFGDKYPASIKKLIPLVW